MDGNDDNYKAIANNNDSYFVNLCDDNDYDNDNEEESWEQKQLKRAIEESIREASASVSTSVSLQSRTTVATALSSSTTTASTSASTATATLSSLTEDEQLILAQTIQLSQIEQHEKELKESMMIDCAIKESHKSHYVDTQNQISMEIAKDLHKQIIVLFFKLIVQY